MFSRYFLVAKMEDDKVLCSTNVMAQNILIKLPLAKPRGTI